MNRALRQPESDIVDEVFESIPKEFVENIKRQKAKQAPRTKLVRWVFYGPLKDYAVLKYFGALDEGEGVYAREVIHNNAIIRVKQMAQMKNIPERRRL